MTNFALNAEVRSDLGKGASRRLRRNESLVPAVIYGGEKPAQSISLLAKDLAKLLENEAAFSHVLTLNVAGANESVVIKALQRHPAKGFVLCTLYIGLYVDNFSHNCHLRVYIKESPCNRSCDSYTLL